MFNVPKKVKRRSWSHDVSGYELSDGGNVWFDVTLDGKTYRIDASHRNHELYEDVPRRIIDLANEAIDAGLTLPIRGELYNSPNKKQAWIDVYEKILDEVFDKVEFISSDWDPDVIY